MKTSDLVDRETALRVYLPEPELDPWLETERRRLTMRLLQIQSDM